MIPVVGGLLIGLLARFVSDGIRGHGLPETMEKILYGDSLIPKSMVILKPIASALAIGTGGPFGVEGPIIATGGSLGSFFGRWTLWGPRERKILLATGAATGLTAIFGTPVAAVMLSIELLLFEFSATTFIPVVVGVGVAYAIRVTMGQRTPVFAMNIDEVEYGANLLYYLLVGSFTGLVSCLVTKSLLSVEDLFEKLPIHWMWWPALGGLGVGIMGYFDPRSLGVGYENVVQALHGQMLMKAALILFFSKFISWVIALGSGTAGGTLAPLMTLGSCCGLVLGHIGLALFPLSHVRPEVCALVGMSAMFAGSTRAILTSTIISLESTGISFSVAPLLLGNSAAYVISTFLMEETLFTEKLSRAGKHIPHEYFHVKTK